MRSVEDRMGTILKQGAFPASIHSARLVILAAPHEREACGGISSAFSCGGIPASCGRQEGISVWTFIRKWSKVLRRDPEPEARRRTDGRGLALAGAIPELDSMAVVTVITTLEERFGFTVADDEIDGSTFATVGSLVAFVKSSLAPDGDPAVRARRGLHAAARGRRTLLPVSSGCRPRRLGAAVYVHPFAEEMNKSRRMAALQARALSAAGISVLQIDLVGCGDSAGDFRDATWPAWVADVADAVRWLRARAGFAPLRLGTPVRLPPCRRGGAMLESAPDLVFWQPVISGRQHLQQFLRLRVAGKLIGRAGADRTGTAELRARLESGATLDIAGYALVPGAGHGARCGRTRAAAGRECALRGSRSRRRSPPSFLPLRRCA